MLRFRFGVLLAAVLLMGCNHHKPANQAQQEAGSAPVANSESPPGKSPYPRALPVAAPISEASPPRTESSSSTASAPPESPGSMASQAAPTPAPSTESMAPSTPAPPSAPAPPAEPQQPQVVVLQTSMGQIVIELDPDAAPKTCANFLKLVSEGFYSHTAFHRVIPNFMIQGGDPNTKTDDRTTYGQGGPGYTLDPEIKLKHDRGAVAMARLPDSVNPQRLSNGSQFYICVAPCPSLDDQYTVFGHVIKGMDVAVKIAEQPRDSKDDPLTRIEMAATLEPKDKALEDSSAVNP